MDPGEKKFPEMEDHPERKKSHRTVRTHDPRRRFYSILLIFVVVTGLPIVSLPSLRHRLVARVVAFRGALSGKSGPVMAKMDEEQLPFPEEYEKPDSALPDSGGQFPMDRIFTRKPADSALKTYSPPALITPESAIADAESSAGSEPEDSSVDPDSKGAITYTQGEVEREIYALLLKSYPRVAEMVEGSDPALKFLSWGGVKRSADIYWLRLVFQTDDDIEVEYIWQVDLQTNQILPLSHNARAIS